MAVDPICKMSVGENEAKYTSMHEGRKFYFCSAACKQQFDKNPQKYAR
jgi:YHS domain-containing protein